MSNAVSRASETQVNLQRCISHHKVLRLDRKRNGKYKHLTIGKQHTESQQNSIYGSRCPHSSHQIEIFRHRNHSNSRIDPLIIDQLSGILDILHPLLHQTGTDTAQYIIEQKTFRPPNQFKRTPKHPHSKHVKKYVLKIGMHKHICNQLCRVKIRSQKEMQSQQVI